jgi:hypothetical protein
LAEQAATVAAAIWLASSSDMLLLGAHGLRAGLGRGDGE